MQRLMLIIGAAMIASTTGPAVAKDKYVYGPAPDWARYKELGEAAVRAKLPDPASWSIEWPNGYTQFIWFHKGRFPGYVTCGVLRAIAPIEGRYPLVNFATVIDYDAVKKVDISGKPSNTIANLVCAELVSSGKLPPAKLTGEPKDLPVPSLGLIVRAMPEGAYIVKAGSGSPAQRAGLAQEWSSRGPTGLHLPAWEPR